MSLARTALRLQAIETLLADPTLRALVEGRVYDSRIDALDAAEPVPTILVYTESSKRTSPDRQNGGAPYILTCNLVIEIALSVTDADGEATVVGVAGTDREAEALLDLIEEAAVLALSEGETDAARLLRQAVTRIDPREVSTERFATNETREKFALFVVTVTCELKTPEPDDVLVPATGPYAALPEPLRSVARAMPAGSGRATCDRLAAAYAPSVPAEPPPVFAGLDLTLAPQPLTPDAQADADAGRVIRAPLDLPAAPT